jgi:hypothetical protein
MSVLGHSRPRHPAPGSPDVGCWSNSGQTRARLDWSLSANRCHMHRSNLQRHSITSSALASSVCGTARPSALAVLRLITSSYLVGVCTDKSDAINVAGGKAELLGLIGPVRTQTAGSNKDAFIVDRRQLVPGRQPGEQVAMRKPERAARRDQPHGKVARQSGHCGKSTRQCWRIAWAMNRSVRPQMNRFRCVYSINKRSACPLSPKMG